MTKKEIEIIQRREYDLCCELDLFEKTYGMHAEITEMKRSEWNGVYQLMKILGIRWKSFINH